METKENKPEDPLVTQLKEFSTVVNTLDIKLTSKTLLDIYEQSKSFSTSIEEYSINKDKFKIIFSEDEQNTVNIKLIKDDKCCFCINQILKIPYKISLNPLLEIKMEDIYIFTMNDYSTLILFLKKNKEKYTYTEDEEKKILVISKYFFTIPDYIFKAIKKRSTILEELKKFNPGIIKINPYILSSNFYHINNHIPEKTEFDFILNDERGYFFKKIEDFIKSDKIFYYITGSNGIGKSLSLLYLSSLDLHKYLYFNIKMYNNIRDDKLFHNIFLNDLHKYFLYNYRDDTESKINSDFYKCVTKIDDIIKKEYIKQIPKIFNYILALIISAPVCNCVIIIDQYKSDITDKNFIGLNEIIKLIIGDRNFFNIKLIISSSIDNTSNKFILLKYLSNIYLDSNQNEIMKLLEEENLENINLYNDNIVTDEVKITEEDDKLGLKDECNFIEEIFAQEKKKMNEDILNQDDNDFPDVITSECELDKYPELTQKDYYSSLVNGKALYEKIFKNEDEISLAKKFNFNLKFIEKYLYLKNNTNKKTNESEKEFINRVKNLFYKNESNKMRKKIRFFYEFLFNSNNMNNAYQKEYNNSLHLEFQSLCKLRSYIFYEKKFPLDDLAKQLVIFPMKYLRIVINNYDKNFFPLMKDSKNRSFKIEYDNYFSFIQINRIIQEIYKNIADIKITSFQGSAEGTYLELKVDEYFRNHKKPIFGLNDIKCRYLFSLVSKTKNSEKTVKEHRIEEAKLLFFGYDNYKIIIDDIDSKEKEHYKLNEICYYFSQISLTGKAFDMCLIYKENDNSYKLYLFQASKNKKSNLGNKKYYLKQAKKVVENLKDLYNINITKIYLIFILPKQIKNQDFIHDLNSNGFGYIFFDLYSKEFSTENDESINNLDFKNCLLEEKEEEALDSQKIDDNLILWENSMKTFINKKRSEEKTFYQIYISNFYIMNEHTLLKINIPKNICTLILNNIGEEEKSTLKFIGNCDFENIDDIRTKHKMIIIYQKNGKVYIKYDYTYLLERKKESYTIKIINENNLNINIALKESEPSKLIQNIIDKSSEKYQKVELRDFIKNATIYGKKCFCYLVVTEKNLKKFYQDYC